MFDITSVWLISLYFVVYVNFSHLRPMPLLQKEFGYSAPTQPVKVRGLWYLRRREVVRLRITS